MSKSKNKNRVSPANIIAVIAVALLGILYFFGTLFQSKDGTLVFPAIKALAFVIAIGVLLFLCIKAKTTEKEFRRWHIFECFSIAAYLIIAVSCYEPFLHFFYVMTHRQSLKTQAMNEIASIDTLCYKFNDEAQSAMDEARDMFISYCVHSDTTVDEIEDYLNTFTLSKASSKKLINEWDSIYYINVVQFKYDKFENVRSKVNTWNPLDMPSIATAMDSLAIKTWDELYEHIFGSDGFIKQFDLIPVVSVSSGYRYQLEKKRKEFNIIGFRPQPSEFSKQFYESGFSKVGIIIYIVLHLLALLNYIFARRSPILQIKKNSDKDDGGILLVENDIEEDEDDDD